MLSKNEADVQNYITLFSQIVLGKYMVLLYMPPSVLRKILVNQWQEYVNP
jgi:hypothetical protein